MLRMKHKHHGFHHAADFHEEARMRTAGWIADTELFPGEKPAPIPMAAPAESTVLDTMPRNRGARL